jgi:hypothetical protein
MLREPIMNALNSRACFPSPPVTERGESRGNPCPTAGFGGRRFELDGPWEEWIAEAERAEIGCSPSQEDRADRARRAGGTDGNDGDDGTDGEGWDDGGRLETFGNPMSPGARSEMPEWRSLGTRSVPRADRVSSLSEAGGPANGPSTEADGRGQPLPPDARVVLIAALVRVLLDLATPARALVSAVNTLLALERCQLRGTLRSLLPDEVRAVIIVALTRVLADPAHPARVVVSAGNSLLALERNRLALDRRPRKESATKLGDPQPPTRPPPEVGAGRDRPRRMPDRSSLEKDELAPDRSPLERDALAPVASMERSGGRSRRLDRVGSGMAASERHDPASIAPDGRRSERGDLPRANAAPLTTGEWR